MGIELIVVLVVIGLQIAVWVKTWGAISRYQDSIPEAKVFKIIKVRVPNPVLQEVDARQLLARPEQYATEYEVNTTELTILRQTADDSETMTKIRTAINTYLLRNKAAVADFNLLKDITQRNIDALEDEVTLMLPVPLYLGLLGTMLGVVIGLYNMPSLNIQQFMEGGGVSNLEGVNSLISGVRAAMLASFIGLLITVINSWRFRGAKVEIESLTHDFFTFLQTELLPILTESVNSGIYDLNRSLDRFGHQFSDTATRLEGIITKNYDALLAQRELLEALDKMDLNRIATFNLSTMEQMQRSLSAFERFALFLDNLTALTDNARQLVERTSDVAGLSDRLTQVLTESQQLQRFLSSHFEQLEQRGQLILNTNDRMQNVVNEALDGLRAHMFERIQAVRDIKLKEEDAMSRLFDENRSALGHLKRLETLEQEVHRLHEQGQAWQRDLLATVGQLSESMRTSNQTLRRLEQLQRATGWQRFRRFLGSDNGMA
ncbi:hypothetical protein [Tellurirhabdus rosea]|uniref:hypothetical protein n=1 Tax=Tellurirhabdus rosea TaxID=2674997 RepID=UPI002259A752|nr:hypothetical protein [Tellurirhabdus rosea]